MEDTESDIEIGHIQTEEITLESVLNAALLNGLGVAAWRNPDRQEIHLIVSLSEIKSENTHQDLETLSPGFMVSPYDNEHNLLHYLIKAELHFIFRINKLNSFSSDEKLGSDRIEEFLNRCVDAQKTTEGSYYPKIEQDDALVHKNDFEQLVKIAIERIAKGEFQKVVPSRSQRIDLGEGFNLSDAFIKLCQKHPKAFISLFSLDGQEIWLGASPELLIKITASRFFYTAAVAGTQPGKNIDNLSEVAWTQKEIEEQALVSRYIINCFKKIRLREFEEEGPKTVKAGGLLHLRTDYKVDLEAVNFPQLGSVMLKLLHPTSAVCGMPREPASFFLRENEHLDRQFYSGYLGPVNIQSETSLYVNLRCARISGRSAELYAGAGVTRDSNPEKEWQETQLKMSTIKDVLIDGN